MFGELNLTLNLIEHQQRRKLEEIFDHVGKRISEGDMALYGREHTS